jgi:hypothetical protein
MLDESTSKPLVLAYGTRVAVKELTVKLPVTVKFVNVPEPEVLLTFTKSEPFHAQTADSPATMVTPVVGPAPTNLTEKPPVVALITV